MQSKNNRTTISNAQVRAQLNASRARVVAAADDARRRLERDLHDGVQQGLVSLALDLRTVESRVPVDLPRLRAQISEIGDGLTRVLDELREISRGIHPAILSEGGLECALKALARRSAVPAMLTVHAQRRLPERVEVAGYYLVAEALTNAAKHAKASIVHVDIEAADECVRISIRDDGVGGADPAQGSGLIGLVDRVEALGGTLTITSPPGTGTSLLASLPLDDNAYACAARPPLTLPWWQANVAGLVASIFSMAASRCRFDEAWEAVRRLLDSGWATLVA
jgi:signal transduction histidine kinase